MDLNSEQLNNEDDTLKIETSLEDDLLDGKTLDELKELKKEILNGSFELEDTTKGNISF